MKTLKIVYINEWDTHDVYLIDGDRSECLIHGEFVPGLAVLELVAKALGCAVVHDEQPHSMEMI